MKATKQKIIKVAIDRFNKFGLTNVRLQHIADDAGISVGNLAYHFKNKRAIIRQIDAELEQYIEPILINERTFVHLIDFDNQLSSYHVLLNQYAFYFLDLLEIERTYPFIHIKRKKYIQRMVKQIAYWIQFHQKQGTFQPAIHENQYQIMAHTTWMIISFWMTQQKVSGLGNTSESSFKKTVWNQFLPIFTPNGLMEYEALILPQLKLDNLVDF